MKTRLILILITYLAGLFSLSAQEPCRVLVKNLEGRYSGECKNGLAHGKGTASGIDVYDGMFKKGYPDGYGIYTWFNGDVYEGKWKSGKQHGEGRFRYKIQGRDTLVSGIWNDGRYVGKRVEQPEVRSKQNITDVRFSRKGEGNEVVLAFLMAGTYNYSVRNLIIDPSSGYVTKLGNEQKIRDVTFPFTCKVSYESDNQLRTATYPCSVDFTITDPGSWEVRLDNN